MIFKVLWCLFKRYNYDIWPRTQIGYGLQIQHHGKVVINPNAVIGNNCVLHHGVTLGNNHRGETPILGDNIFVGVNAVIIGNVRVGNNAVIGAGAVVTKDVPDNAVVAGNPAKVISFNNGTFMRNIYRV